MLTAFGNLESVFFRGVGPSGYDIYGAKFAGGLGEFRVRLGADGNIEDIAFRADGDSTPGETLTCAQEQTLQAAGATVPIQLLIYNASGVDIRIFALDSDGKRSRALMIGDDRSASFLARDSFEIKLVRLRLPVSRDLKVEPRGSLVITHSAGGKESRLTLEPIGSGGAKNSIHTSSSMAPRPGVSVRVTTQARKMPMTDARATRTAASQTVVQMSW